MDVRLQSARHDRSEDLTAEERIADGVGCGEEFVNVCGRSGGGDDKDMRVEVETSDELDGQKRVGTYAVHGIRLKFPQSARTATHL